MFRYLYIPAVFVAWCAAPHLHADTTAAVWRIGTITVDCRPVFDVQRGEDPLQVGRIANWINTPTAPRVVRNELLFKEGDVYDQDRIDETERNLRDLGYVGDIEIVRDTVLPGTINLAIHTHDKWAKIIETSYEQDGGEYEVLAAARDYNFWGQGKSFSAAVDYKSKRDEPYGLQFTLSDPRLFDSRWKIAWQYQDTDELQHTALGALRPFYATEATWSAGASFDRGRELVTLYAPHNRGAIDQRGDVQYDREGMMGMYAVPGAPTWYLGAAALRRRAESDTIQLSNNDNLDMVMGLVTCMQRTYYKDRDLDNIGRVEDVPVGYAAHLLAGASWRPPSAGAFDYYSLAVFQCAGRWLPRWYLAGAATLSSFWESSAWDRSQHQVAASILQHVRLPGQQLLVVRTGTQLAYRWPERRQLILDSPNGLRGYPTYQFSGQRKILCNVEDRFATPISWWIFRLGGVVFADLGTVWDQGEKLGNTRWHTACGVGVRVGNVKQRGGGVVRVDWAFTLDERRFAQLIITSGQTVSAFNALNILTPDTIVE